MCFIIFMIFDCYLLFLLYLLYFALCTFNNYTRNSQRNSILFRPRKAYAVAPIIERHPRITEQSGSCSCRQQWQAAMAGSSGRQLQWAAIRTKFSIKIVLQKTAAYIRALSIFASSSAPQPGL